MKTRFPLYAKILLFFLLNLVFLGAVFYAFFQFQFRSGLDSLLMTQAGERVQAVSKLVASELDETPGTNWNRVIERFSDAYRTRFFLFRNDGVQTGGESISLPPEVLAKVKEPRGMGMGMGRRGPPPGRGPNRFLEGTNSWSPPGRGFYRFGTSINAEPLAKFLVHSQNPGGYWIGVCLPSLNNSQTGQSPLILLAMSPSLRGGLFPDLTPWLLVGLGAVLCSALFWLPLVHGITQFIAQTTRATEQIAEGHFETPIKTARNDELGRLGQAINRMSARLSGFVNGQRRFMGDIAHELCSPIARMQVALGILEEKSTPQQQACVADVREDLQQMSSLINELLSFSKAALRQQNMALKPVPLAALVRQVLDREQTNSNAVRIDINESLQALAEPELLARALGNLLRNAIRYAGTEGPIQVSTTPDPKTDTITIAVADSGPGVPEASLEQIFDPFHRIESSRSRETGGVGLGLAIVKTCVEACQGRVVAKNRKPSGLQVEITLKTTESPTRL
jgi:two-component system sensor histidine kinase CpxA